MDNEEGKRCEFSEAAKAARREYRRKWQREHPEKTREYTRRYWEKKAAELQEREAANANHN